MKKRFMLTVDKAAFRETIMNMQSQADDNLHIANAIKAMLLIDGREIRYRNTDLFYDTFMDICQQHKIKVTPYEETQNERSIYKVAIEVNGLESHSMSYKGKEKNITTALAAALYKALGTQVENNLFIDDVKNGRV
jgi:hypothetical protein